jgi:hypothetical protein
MTKSGVVVLLLVGGLAVPVYAKKKKDAPLPQLFCQAQFAYVQTVDGDVMNPNILPEDRDAANALYERLQDWKRYTLVMNRRDADLVFVVRTGRVASGMSNNPYPTQGPNVPGADPQARVPIGGNPGRGQNPGSGPYPGGQGGPGGGPGSGGPGMGGPGMGPDANGQYGTGMSPVDTRGMGGEVGPPNDLLAIYMKPGEESLHAPLWQHSEKDGLQGPMPLFQKIRDAVDTACVAGAGKSAPQ